ncbi:MAG: FAD-dependent oxidoreductase [Fimbriimonadales bacterium]|nr:FAD-dependent oxidoreductase [Fimbriimonadales bacterium]
MRGTFNAKVDVLIVGGSLGGCAAAMACASLGVKTLLATEPDQWIGGQLTAQAVPPDEHRWIETQGCTRRYRQLREAIRDFYRRYYPLTETARSDPHLNPGGGWVSRLCHEPRVAKIVLESMLHYPQMRGDLIVEPLRLHAVDGDGDFLRGVLFYYPDQPATLYVEARYILDATDTGELLPLAGAEYVTGAESHWETGEPHAKPEPQPANMQAFTWCFALGYDPKGNYVGSKPKGYEFWKAFRPPFAHAPLFSWIDIDPITHAPRRLSLFGEDGTPSMFRYRQIVDPALYPPEVAPEPVTIVNWFMNDYFLGPLYPPAGAESSGSMPDPSAVPSAYGFTNAEIPNATLSHAMAARTLSECLLYWLQTEAPRPDGGVGYPGLHLRPDITGTDDNPYHKLAQRVYVRESRRIKARFTILEQHVSAELRPNATLAEPFPDSVGVGHYRIDLHPTTGGDNYLDIPTLPFQIPLGALIPIRLRNLLPACKNIGTTHITNGCYRLHPVEWNIGESAGLLAAFCVLRGVEPHQVYESPSLLHEYQQLLRQQGIQLAWEL